MGLRVNVGTAHVYPPMLGRARPQPELAVAVYIPGIMCASSSAETTRLARTTFDTASWSACSRVVKDGLVRRQRHKELANCLSPQLHGAHSNFRDIHCNPVLRACQLRQLAMQGILCRLRGGTSHTTMTADGCVHLVCHQIMQHDLASGVDRSSTAACFVCTKLEGFVRSCAVVCAQLRAAAYLPPNVLE
jgi:hypothetical protein